MVDLVGRLARTILASRVVPAGCQPLRRGAGDIGLGVVPTISTRAGSGRCISSRACWKMAAAGLVTCTSSEITSGSNHSFQPSLSRRHALRQAETVGDDPIFTLLFNTCRVSTTLQWHAQGDDLLQEGIVHRHRRHVHLFGKQEKRVCCRWVASISPELYCCQSRWLRAWYSAILGGSASRRKCAASVPAPGRPGNRAVFRPDRTTPSHNLVLSRDPLLFWLIKFIAPPQRAGQQIQCQSDPESGHLAADHAIAALVAKTAQVEVQPGVWAGTKRLRKRAASM